MLSKSSLAAAACLLAGAASAADPSPVVEKIGAKCKIVSQDEWHGGRRIVFDFNGEEAWVVVPAADEASGRPWTWTMEWPTAFVSRTGAPAMLARGWHHVTLRPGFYKDGKFVSRPGNMNDERLGRSREYQRFLVEELGFAAKACLIGMSWGGFYSVRYSATYPECVRRAYLDAPLLDFTTLPNWTKGNICETYRVQPGYVGAADPRMPVNMAESMAKGGVEVLLLYGGQDQTVPPAKNCELFVPRFLAAGGNLANGIRDGENRGRSAYGHHPHGLELDAQAKFVDFFENGAK